MKKSRKLSLAVGGAVVVLVGGVWGYTTLNGATPLDASKMATVERGTMTRSVVATGKIEPITKVEIKSKANGIIERINTDVDHIVEVGAVLVELDKENLRAREREALANLQAARAALEGAAAHRAQVAIRDDGPQHHEEEAHERQIAPGADQLGDFPAAGSTDEDHHLRHAINHAARDDDARPAIQQRCEWGSHVRWVDRAPNAAVRSHLLKADLLQTDNGHTGEL